MPAGPSLPMKRNYLGEIAKLDEKIAHHENKAEYHQHKISDLLGSLDSIRPYEQTLGGYLRKLADAIDFSFRLMWHFGEPEYHQFIARGFRYQKELIIESLHSYTLKDIFCEPSLAAEIAAEKQRALKALTGQQAQA